MTDDLPVRGLVTLGEALVAVRAVEPGPLRAGTTAVLDVAGAEATVAMGVRRLGHPARWVGRLGADSLGVLVRRTLAAEGVEVSAEDAAGRPTGVMVREQRTADVARVVYLRRESAGAALAPEDVPLEAVRAAGVLHVTGITPALSASAAKAVRLAVETARSAGVTVCFDVNHRPALWPDEEAVPVLRGLAADADVLVAGRTEAALLLGRAGHHPGHQDASPEELARSLLALGPGEAVVTDGSSGAAAATAAGTHRVAAVAVTTTDPVGAGDAFVAGYLSASLDRLPVPDRLDRAARCAAFAVSTAGDAHGLPTRAELALLDGPDVVR